MEYFKLLHLTKEPFSNSPDPAFFYASRQHKDCMQKLEIAVRLRRGLNVVVGEVGTGKTTLCRQLIQTFSDDPRVSACLVLDPDFPDPRAFLSAIVHMMTGSKPAAEDAIPVMKEMLKHYLFQTGVEEDRTVVLIVDEGQKMPPACLETLRELLNFETNEYKLLQIVIFAQNEFADTLNSLPNLADRINLYYRLNPLPFRDFRALIRHRIQSAATPEAAAPRRLFSTPALWRIHRASGGYPRKIIHLCHQCLLAMIIQNKTTAGWRIAGACARRTFTGARTFRPVPVAITTLILVLIGFGVWQYFPKPGNNRVSNQNRTADSVLAATSPEQNGDKNAIPLPAQNPADPLPFPPSGDPDIQTEAAVTPSPKTPLEEIAAPPPFGEPSVEDIVSPEAPSVLGRVPVAVGDTLGGLVQTVYGAYTYRYHQALIDANPRLVDPDRLAVGEMLAFPAIPGNTADMPDTTWWVSLSREPDLEAAVATLRKQIAGGFPLRLLTIQAPEENLSFRIVLKTCFNNEDLATLAKEQLAPSTTTTPEVICLDKSKELIYGTIGVPVSVSIQNTVEPLTMRLTGVKNAKNIEHRTSNIE